MKPRTARYLLVIAVFALLAVLSGTAMYISDVGRPEVLGERRTIPPGQIFLYQLRYYIAWALVTPGVLWLGRRVPLRRGSWAAPLAFHALVPVAGCLPFFFLRALLLPAFGRAFPAWDFWTTLPWGLVFAVQALMVAPVYWLLLAAGAALRVSRSLSAHELREVHLRRSLADAQLDALRMKLQPHFLFNALNAIGSLAQEGDTDEVVRLVEHLGTMLRLSMETSGHQLVSLDEELVLLDAYLAVEEIRHKGRLAVVRDIDPQLGRALLPSLILQPLADNAIVHALGARIDSTRIGIAARRSGEELELVVRDDGPGLPAGWTLAGGAGRGLANVVERLEALYGDRARLAVEPGAAGGTVSRLRLPLQLAPAPEAGSLAWSA